MTDEEKQTLKYFYNFRASIDESYMLFGEELNVKCGKELIKQITTVLNLIGKQEKVIDEMTKELDLAYNNENKYYLNFEKNICKRLINPQSEEDDCYSDIYDERSCLNCIKEFFYKKVENEK